MKIDLLPDPVFWDLAGWKAYLDELRSMPEDTIGRDVGIEWAEIMIRQLTEYAKSTTPENSPTKAD
ncbi:hypothetical protein [Thalassovita litoralis]|uniref:hypothetical protein n=1 Tax=Thalassovita litoralis TaxID=1010611 RepID=UPI00163D5AE1|nr:hypothetical protein [Thalassovita litoralis]